MKTKTIAVNVKSEKAYYEILNQLEKHGYITPLQEKPSHMHKWHEYGRKTVLFVDTNAKLITYESIEYAENLKYNIKLFKPKSDIKEFSLVS